jgi:hypothetical protein
MKDVDREDLLVLSSASDDGEAYEYISEDEAPESGRGGTRSRRGSRRSRQQLSAQPQPHQQYDNDHDVDEFSERPLSNTDTAASTAGSSVAPISSSQARSRC